MTPPRLVVLAAILLCGCSKPYQSDRLALTYEPPSGFEFIGEDAGPPAVARFGGGLEIRSVPQSLSPTDVAPERILEQALEAAQVPSGGKVLTAREGSIGSAHVLRYTLKGNGRRSLLYVVPRPSRFLLVLLTAPEDTYGSAEIKVERSLGSLKLRD